MDSPSTNETIDAYRTLRHSNHIFFPFQYAARETMWERGIEPKTSYTFTGEIDAYGQALDNLSIAVPRGKNPLTGSGILSAPVYDAAEPYQVVHSRSTFIYKDDASLFIVDRISEARTEQITGTASLNVFSIREGVFGGSLTKNLLSHQLTYYDGAQFAGLPLGELGSFGLPVRSESLVVTPTELTAIYGSGNIPPAFSGSANPNWAGYPAAFTSALHDVRLGYSYYNGSDAHEAGYYATGDKLKYDFQDAAVPDKGLVMAMRNVYNHESTILYDNYHLLPLRVTDPTGMKAESLNDYRLLTPRQMTDPNNNMTQVEYNSLGLVNKMILLGKGSEGDNAANPGATFVYDFFAFMNEGDPISVLKAVREHHINASYLPSVPAAERNNTIQSAEYSDGYGRIVQSRAQAEDIIYGNQTFGDSGLPADPSQNGPAVGVARSGSAPLNVAVSGHKRYNNKGEMVEQYEPYFDSGFDYAEDDANQGVSLKMYYDALGRMVKTVNPDGSQQRIVFGIPNALNSPDIYAQSPWERYTYDANDLAGETHPSGLTQPSHHYTPKSEKIDTLGRVKETTEHNAQPIGGSVYENVVMKYLYDIKGQLLQAIDPYNRVISRNKYDTGGNMLSTTQIDRGAQNITVDALGLPIVSNDAKGGRTLSNYDTLRRPTALFARDKTGEALTRRVVNSYGDSAGLSNPHLKNLKGQLYRQYDSVGRIDFTDYDFKGNLLKKDRRVLKDTLLTGQAKYVADWATLTDTSLEAKPYLTDLTYDALNRPRSMVYPEDVSSTRRTALMTYARSGAQVSHRFNNIDYVREMAYNAKGQMLFMASGGLMHRYAYDPQTFRMVRKRAELFTKTGNTYTPAAGIRLDRAYSYDLMGSVVRERDTTPGNVFAQGPGDLTRTFVHDPLRRLISATGRENKTLLPQPTWDLNVRPEDFTATNLYTRTYNYDKLGNIQSLRHTTDTLPANNFTRIYNYDPGFAHNKLTNFQIGANTYAFTYDANGNQTKENTDRYYEWNYGDKLAFFKRQAGVASPTVWSHYLYDGEGNRIKKVVNKAGNKQEVTVYIDGVYEYSYTKTNGVVDTNRNFNTLHVMVAGARVATQRIGNNADDTTPTTKYFVEDHLGNCAVTVEASGNRLNMEEYYPFGETSFGSFAKKRYRYNGKEKDEESGLYNYGQRYYAPWLCRFVSVDPIAEDYPQLSSYNYAGNKPVTHVDIDGLQSNGGDGSHSERKRENGTDIKDGSRKNDDTLYEMHNLPSDPVDGQKEIFHYTKGEQRQIEWTYNKESDAWGIRAKSFEDILAGTEKTPSDFWLPAKHSEINNIDPPVMGDSTAHDLVTEGSTENSERQNKAEADKKVNPIINEVHDAITSDEGNAVASVSDIIVSSVESAAVDAQNLKPKYHHSNPNVNAPSNLKGLIRFTGFATKILGVTAFIQHGTEAWEAIKKGDTKNAALSIAKIGVDAAFTIAKTTNPIVLGLSIAYNVLDMAGFLKF